jgi:hypothetical protein
MQQLLSWLLTHIAGPDTDEYNYHDNGYEYPVCNTEAKHRIHPLQPYHHWEQHPGDQGIRTKTRHTIHHAG